MIEAVVGGGERFGLAITYSHEQPEALETGGGIFRALPLLGSAPFLLVNGDVWTDIDFCALRRGPPAGSLAHLVLVPNPPQHARGDFLLEGGKVCEGEGLRYTYSGIGIYRPEFVAGCTPGTRFCHLLRRAIAGRALSGELHAGRWYDVGTVSDWPASTRSCQPVVRRQKLKRSSGSRCCSARCWARRWSASSWTESTRGWTSAGRRALSIVEPLFLRLVQLSGG
jgi:NDP-sugar pyrophosphorylase family protein